MTAHDHLQVETVDAVTTVRLDRPQTLNALDRRLTLELLDVLRAVDGDDATRAVVLTGNGRGFCSGADLADLAEAAAGGTAAGPAGLRGYLREGPVTLARTLLDLEKPVVAAVNGPCAGAGIGLALACDFVLAAEEAVFSVAFVNRGLVPDYGVTWLLPRLVGLRTARELCLLGDRLSAADADRLGLLTRVVPGSDLLTEADALARRLADGAGLALRLTKRLLTDSSQVDHATAVDREFAAQALCLSSADAAEGAAAFLEKRAPRFRSR